MFVATFAPVVGSRRPRQERWIDQISRFTGAAYQRLALLESVERSRAATVLLVVLLAVLPLLSWDDNDDGPKRNARHRCWADQELRDWAGATPAWTAFGRPDSHRIGRCDSGSLPPRRTAKVLYERTQILMCLSPRRRLENANDRKRPADRDQSVCRCVSLDRETSAIVLIEIDAIVRGSSQHVRTALLTRSCIRADKQLHCGHSSARILLT